MSPIIITSALALLNIVQFCLGLKKDRRLKKYQDFEYAVHLQLVDEEVALLSESFGHAFHYSAKIENCGSKPVQIKNVLLEYGSGNNLGKRFKLQIEREFYLRTGERQEIKVFLSSDEIAKANSTFELNDCNISLRINYINPLGALEQKERHLVSTGTSGHIFVPKGAIIA